MDGSRKQEDKMMEQTKFFIKEIPKYMREHGGWLKIKKAFAPALVNIPKMTHPMRSFKRFKTWKAAVQTG